jgi:hypothetical protein
MREATKMIRKKEEEFFNLRMGITIMKNLGMI